MAYRKYINSDEIQKDLEKVILKDPNLYNRASAVKKLNNMEMLRALAVNDPAPVIRREAVLRLNDDHLIAKIAFHDPDIEVRKAATSILQDQECLRTLALSDQDYHIREIAVKRIDKNERSTIEKIALEDEYWMVRYAATWRLAAEINNCDLFFKIAKDESEDVRKAAIEHLVDQNMLFALWKEEKSVKVRNAAIQRITMQAHLEKMYTLEEDADLRENIVTKLDNQDLLAKIAIDDPAIWVREQAVYRLETGHDELFMRVAMHDKDENIRALATKKVQEQNILCKIVQESVYSDSAIVAISRLEDLTILVALRLTASTPLQKYIQSRITELQAKT